MNNQILKTILVGALLGAALFWMPFFILKVLVFFLVIGFFFRFFKGRRYYGPSGWSYADKIRTMSDEEYTTFKENYRGRCGNYQKENHKNQEQ
jgi:hypothetical protein